MPDYKYSVAAYSFHQMINDGDLDVYGYFDLLKYRYHVDYADIWTEGCLKSLDEDYLRKVRKAMDQRGLKLADLCVDGPYVWIDDKDERAEHKKTMLKYLKAAEILGANTVRIDFGYGHDGFMGAMNDYKAKGIEGVMTMSDEAFEYIVDTYREYCDIVSAFGCKIGPENHWGWDRIPEYLKKVHEAVNHPNYGHLYHLRGFYEYDEAAEDFCVANAMHTHFHASSVLYAKEVIRKLLKVNYQGTFGLEHHSAFLETERVDWQLGTLRAIIAEVRAEEEGIVTDTDFMNDIYAGRRQY